jgi:hypothetical protein
VKTHTDNELKHTSVNVHPVFTVIITTIISTTIASSSPRYFVWNYSKFCFSLKMVIHIHDIYVTLVIFPAVLKSYGHLQITIVLRVNSISSRLTISTVLQTAIFGHLFPSPMAGKPRNFRGNEHIHCDLLGYHTVYSGCLLQRFGVTYHYHLKGWTNPNTQYS